MRQRRELKSKRASTQPVAGFTAETARPGSLGNGLRERLW